MDGSQFPFWWTRRRRGGAALKVLYAREELNTSLDGAANAGATTITLSNVLGLRAGDRITIGRGAWGTREQRIVASITDFDVTLTQALTSNKANGDDVCFFPLLANTDDSIVVPGSGPIEVYYTAGMITNSVGIAANDYFQTGWAWYNDGYGWYKTRGNSSNYFAGVQTPEGQADASLTTYVVGVVHRNQVASYIWSMEFDPADRTIEFLKANANNSPYTAYLKGIMILG